MLRATSSSGYETTNQQPLFSFMHTYALILCRGGTFSFKVT